MKIIIGKKLRTALQMKNKKNPKLLKSNQNNHKLYLYIWPPYFVRGMNDQGRKRIIFQRGQSQFSWFFSGVKYDFSPRKLSILVDPKQISQIQLFQKVTRQKKKKFIFIPFPTKQLFF